MALRKLILLFCVVLPSCKNATIQQGSASSDPRFYALVDIINNSFRFHDSQPLKNNASAEIQDKLAYFDTMVAIQSVNKALKKGRIIYERDIDSKEVNFKSKLNNKYEFQFKASAKANEMHALLYTLPDEGGMATCLISVVFVKEDGSWTIRNLSVGKLEYKGSNAFDWYKKALERYQKKDILSFKHYANICMTLLRPAGNYLKFSASDQIDSFYYASITSLDIGGYMKQLLGQVNSGPVFTDYTSEFLSGRFYPMIVYVSNIDLHNQTELQRENDAIDKIIKNAGQSSEKFADTILYRVYNRKSNRDYYGFVRAQ